MMKNIFTRIVSLLVGLFIIFTLVHCSSDKSQIRRKKDDDGIQTSGMLHVVTPTKKLEYRDYPEFVDDLKFKNLDMALDRQIARYKKRSLAGTIKFGKEVYKKVDVETSLVRFKKYLDEYRQCKKKRILDFICAQEFRKAIKLNFNVYIPELVEGDPRYGEKKSTKFTAYYTPTLKGSRTKSKFYKYPVYKAPQDKILKRKTREEIDFEGALDNKNLELFYTNDLFEVYLLQVEGGGRVQFQDGSSHYLSYDGTNRREWKFISIYMNEKGYINDYSILSQKRFLAKHPELYREIYSTCPSYVFFKKSIEQPEGSDLVSLTNNRSIATDYRIYPFKGVLTFIKTRRLKENLKKNKDKPTDIDFFNFSRFTLDQDTGGAIKGKARVDIYFGEDKYAALASQHQNHLGELFFLMLKPEAL